MTEPAGERTESVYARVATERSDSPADAQWLTDRITELELEAENRDEALALIAHELRTPLTVLQGGIWLLRHRPDRQDEATRDELLETLEHQASFLSLSLVNMLTLARIQSDEPADLEPIVLREEVRLAVEAFHQMASARGVKVDIPTDLPPVLAHATYTQEMLVNLLVNADRYTPASSVVTVSAGECADDQVCVSITDKGDGLPEDELGQIFERFFQSSRRPDSGSGTGTGTGLGLTVCKRMARAQNGDIWAENMPGEGLRVTFSLQACAPV